MESSLGLGFLAIFWETVVLLETVFILCHLKHTFSFPVWCWGRMWNSIVSVFSSTLIRYQIPLFCLNWQPALDRQHKCIPALFLYFFFQLLTCCHNTVHCSSYLQVHVQSYILASLSGRPVNNSVLFYNQGKILPRERKLPSNSSLHYLDQISKISEKGRTCVSINGLLLFFHQNKHTTLINK